MKMIKSRAGITLIELMVVVAIVGILASIGTVAYGRYIKAGKIERLKSIAMQIQSGQERYRSRNNTYFPPTPGTVNWDVSDDRDRIKPLLDFDTTPPSGVSFEIASWNAEGSCAICDSNVPVDTSRIGWAIRVTQDLGSASGDTTVYLTNSSPAPVVVNE